MSQQDDNSMGHSMEINPINLAKPPTGNPYNFNLNLLGNGHPAGANQHLEGPNIFFSQDLAQSQVLPDENS